MILICSSSRWRADGGVEGNSRLWWDLHLSLSCNPQEEQSQNPPEPPRPRHPAPRRGKKKPKRKTKPNFQKKLLSTGSAGSGGVWRERFPHVDRRRTQTRVTAGGGASDPECSHPAGIKPSCRRRPPSSRFSPASSFRKLPQDLGVFVRQELTTKVLLGDSAERT